MVVKKAVFPVAGLGSRFLPVTKANPKEMLPIVDKPLIQYAVEEAVAAGIDTMISPPHIQFTYVRQNQPLGLGHAVLCAEHVVGDSSFAVLLADDLMDESTFPCLKTMTEHYEQSSESIVAVQAVPWADVHQYGVVDVGGSSIDYAPIQSIIEKPTQTMAPSNLAAIGRYIFTPTIFSCLKKTRIDQRGEIQLTDAIRLLLAEEKVHAFHYHGKRYDCGSKLGYLQATVEFGMRHPEIGRAFFEYLQTAPSLS